MATVVQHASVTLYRAKWLLVYAVINNNNNNITYTIKQLSITRVLKEEILSHSRPPMTKELYNTIMVQHSMDTDL